MVVSPMAVIDVGELVTPDASQYNPPVISSREGGKITSLPGAWRYTLPTIVVQFDILSKSVGAKRPIVVPGCPQITESAKRLEKHTLSRDETGNEQINEQ